MKDRRGIEEEKERNKLLISRRHHARLINENMDATGLYSTLTFSNEYEEHTFDEARIVRNSFFRRLKYHHPDESEKNDIKKDGV